MSEKYHLSPSTGNPNRCYAKKRCPLGASDEEHYGSKEEARAAYEKQQSAALAKPVRKKRAPRKAAVAETSTPEEVQEMDETSPDDDFSDIKCEDCNRPLDRCVCGECEYCSALEGDEHEEDCPQAKAKGYRYSWE